MTRSISVDEFIAESNARLKKRGKGKFNAKKVEYCGHKFDSKAEWRRYLELERLALCRAITDLVVHPSFVIASGIYTADFQYRRAGVLHVEDVKGKRTDASTVRMKQVSRNGVVVDLLTRESHPHLWTEKK